MLGVLDGAVLVVSAVEGVQAQTRVLMRALQRLRIPTLVFVNKIDRGGARAAPLLDAMLTPPRPCDRAGRGRRRALRPYGRPTPLAPTGWSCSPARRRALAAYVDDPRAPSGRAPQLAQTRASALVHPVFFGSAITGAGVDALMDALPRAAARGRGRPRRARLGRGVQDRARRRRGEKIAYVRLRAGTLRARDRVRLRGGDGRR